MPVRRLVMRPVVPRALRRATVEAGVVRLSSAFRYSDKPATWGVAIEVPEMVLVAEAEPIHASTI